jgi:hypothetical protein
MSTDRDILTHVNTDPPDERGPKLDTYISEQILDAYEPIPIIYAIMNCMI